MTPAVRATYAILCVMNYYIAVDIGGTQLRAACYPCGQLMYSKADRISTQYQSTTPLERLENLITSIWPEDGSVSAIGVAAPGPIDPFLGVIHEAPNIPGWVELPLRQHLEQRFKIPVALGNDANLAALGEWKYGVGRGHRHLVYLTISTGIGGGVIIDNRLLLGAHGLAAELGHVTILPDGPMCGCGLRGHLEAVAAGPAIARWVEQQLSNGVPSSIKMVKPLTAKEVGEAAKAGDSLAISALERAGTFIGSLLGDYLHIFNPSIVIIGGGVSKTGDLLLKPMRTAMEKHVYSPFYLDDLVLTTAALGDDVGLIGALALAASTVEETQSKP